MRGAAVIVQDGKILLIHRIKPGRDYFVLPGGGVEEGETVEEATVREVKEETSLDAVLGRRLWVEHDALDGRDHYVYLVSDFSGEVQLGGEEQALHSESNQYILEWHAYSDIDALPVFSDMTKRQLQSFCEYIQCAV